ncbi:lipopolysaccharide export system protein LptC [Gellertiella hungarica]|uniref:Lipopolysaccharide export system protein LptC n=2 Tax=Gellertiella hungarica TaxID=1572859 RepID=A0A7W6NK00_9HYPH|nr:lipopolysaccharide export system protein LptC [Gellertiella hungarica]
MNVLTPVQGADRKTPFAQSYANAMAHSRRVKRLKVLLPLAALLISLAFIAVSVVRTYLPEDISVGGVKIEDGKIVMEKPAVSGRNSEGISYTMLAERALQDIKNPDLITLQTIKASVPVTKDVLASVTAIEALYNRAKDDLAMTAPFSINLSSGIQAEFQAAQLDVKAGRMETAKPVAITTKSASILAESMKMTDKGRTILFKGKVKVSIEAAAVHKLQN